MKSGVIFIGTGLSILFVGLLLYGIFSDFGETKKGDCFDRYGNKINELTCDVSIIPEEVEPIVSVLIGVGVIFLVGGAIFFVVEEIV